MFLTFCTTSIFEKHENVNDCFVAINESSWTCDESQPCAPRAALNLFGLFWLHAYCTGDPAIWFYASICGFNRSERGIWVITFPFLTGKYVALIRSKPFGFCFLCIYTKQLKIYFVVKNCTTTVRKLLVVSWSYENNDVKWSTVSNNAI